MTDQFTVRVGEKDYGPVDLALLRSWRAEGRLLPESLVWKHGSPGWVPLSTILEPQDELTVLVPGPTAPSPSDDGATVLVGSPGLTSQGESGTAPRSPAAEPTAELWQLGMDEARRSNAPAGAPRVVDHPLSSHPAPGPSSRQGASPHGAGAFAGAADLSKEASRSAALSTPRGEAPEPASRRTPPEAVAPSHGVRPPEGSANLGTAAAPQIAPSRPRPMPPVRRPPTPAVSIPLGWVLLAGIALVTAIGTVFAYSAFLKPILAKRRVIAEVRQKVLPDRKLADPAAGLEIALPSGWYLLPADDTLVLDPGSRSRLAHPSAGAFASLRMEEHPRLDVTLEAYAERQIDSRRLLQPDVEPTGAHRGRVAGQPSRTVELRWTAEGAETEAALLVWRDAWRWYTLTVWVGKASAESPTAMAAALAGGVSHTDRLSDRLAAATTGLENDAPELGRASARLLAMDALAKGLPIDLLPVTAFREVSRGLHALGPDEVRELTAIYAQVYAPVPDGERARLATWLAAVRDGRNAPRDETLAMRALLNQGILSLSEESRARLVELNAKAVTAALAS